MIRLSGRLRSALIIGGQGIRARKLRTALSMVSLFLGVLAIVVVQAGAEIANRAMLSDVELNEGKDGTTLMYVPGERRAIAAILATLKGATDAVATIGTTAIIGEPAVNPVNHGGGSFRHGGDFGGMEMYCDDSGECYEGEPPAGGTPTGAAIELRVVAMTGDVRQFRPYRLGSGHWLDFTGEPSLSPRIVLNRDAALGFSQHRVPAEMRIPGAKVTATPRIVGVVNDGEWTGPTAYVRADELLNWMPVADSNDPYGNGVDVLFAPTATETQQELRSALTRAGVNQGQINIRTVDYGEYMADELALMRWVFLGMAALVLLIGVAGILNVSLATVGERIEEFALRRAIGTPRLLLGGMVLAETLIVGLLTAAAAIGCGIVGLRLMSELFGTQEPFLANVAFPWQAGVAGVIAGVAAGVLGGLIPAIRASRIPIATVMRA